MNLLATDLTCSVIRLMDDVVAIKCLGHAAQPALKTPSKCEAGCTRGGLWGMER